MHQLSGTHTSKKTPIYLKRYSFEQQGTPAIILETGSVLNSLKRNSLEHCWLHNQPRMLYRISSQLVNISLTSFCQHADPWKRGAQHLHQERTSHPVTFNSFKHHQRLESSSNCHHLSNFLPVVPEPVWYQPPQPAANSHSPMPMNPAPCKYFKPF